MFHFNHLWNILKIRIGNNNVTVKSIAAKDKKKKSDMTIQNTFTKSSLVNPFQLTQASANPF